MQSTGDSERLCSLSVDLDEIHHYYSIHAGKPPGGVNLHAVYDRAISRFEQIAREEQLPLTFFAVGSDLARTGNSDVLRRVVDAGHELGNHSLDHRYDLTRLPVGEIHKQIAEANDGFEREVGVRPTGFRAPGYCINEAVYAALGRLGMRYSSSVFPCPAYYTAKAGAMALIRLRGRHSASIVDDARVLLAPTEPYRVGSPYWRRGGGFVELPIGVTPRLRLPFIGTALSLGGPRVAARLAGAMVGTPFINLELHGVDLLDASDGLTNLAGRQRDLRVGVAKKRAVLRSIIGQLRAAGYQFVRLDEAARRMVPPTS